jgi:hypothetical protein
MKRVDTKWSLLRCKRGNSLQIKAKQILGYGIYLEYHRSESYLKAGNFSCISVFQFLQTKAEITDAASIGVAILPGK